MSASLRKVLAIARHELIGTVTRVGYVVTLVGMPLFIGGLGGLSGLATSRVMLQQLNEEKRVGVVDDSGLYAQAPDFVPPAQPRPRGPGFLRGAPKTASKGLRILRVATLDEALRQLSAGELDSVLHVPARFLQSGRLEEYRRSRKGMALAPELEGPARALRAWLVEGLLRGKVDPAIAARAARPAEVETWVVDASGKPQAEDLLRELKPFAVPLGFAVLLLLSIFTSASYLATGLAEDKQNRALEMLLTSVTPEQLFWGKLLGLWGAAFLQFGLYLAVVALPAGLMFAALGIHAGLVATALAYFVLGFFFFGAVLLAVGSIGSSHKYTQQLSGLVTFTAIVPMLMLPALLSDPSGPLARTLTYIPFTAPLTGMLRAGASALPFWELVASLLVMGGAVWLVIRGSAKIFRVALLATGSSPGLRQLWRWLRA